MTRVEAVVVCVNYSDFLVWSLPHNKPHFDRLVVVTSPQDVATRRVCEHNHVECVVTDAMYAGGAPFNKGRAVNAGLDRLDFAGWCAHLDADVVLPPRAREMLDLVGLREDALYSVDRLMVPSFEAWADFTLNPSPQHADWRVRPGPFPVGYRLNLATARWRGWVPAGYFQLFHRSAPAFDARPWYPEEYPTAADSDMAFSEKWARGNRSLLPELYAYHLDSAGGGDRPVGANWSGRRTPLFAPASLTRAD